MALNIKNRETQQLAKELAEPTGESMTSAVTEAVRARLERMRQEQGEGLADRLLKIGSSRLVGSAFSQPYPRTVL